MLDPMQLYRSTAQDVPTVLADHGLVFIEGIADEMSLLRLARSIATVIPCRDSDPDGVTAIAGRCPGNVRSGFAGFSACALNPHTCESGVAHPRGLVITICRRPAAIGGACVLVDGQAVYHDLAASEPDALRAFRTPRSVLFGGAAGHLGAIFDDLDDGRVAIRLRLDDLAQFSPDVGRWLPALRAAIDRHAITFALRAGEGYIVNNYRWLHGRRAFTGQRVLYRVIGNPLPRLDIPLGFRPLRRLSSSTAA